MIQAFIVARLIELAVFSVLGGLASLLLYAQVDGLGLGQFVAGIFSCLAGWALFELGFGFIVVQAVASRLLRKRMTARVAALSIAAVAWAGALLYFRPGSLAADYSGLPLATALLISFVAAQALAEWSGDRLKGGLTRTA